MLERGSTLYLYRLFEGLQETPEDGIALHATRHNKANFGVRVKGENRPFVGEESSYDRLVLP